MALIPCPECQSQVSDRAVACPRCGHPIGAEDAGSRRAAIPAEPEGLGFDLVLAKSGPRKIAVIKAVREVTDLGLREAKDLVEDAPSVVLRAVSRERAEAARRELEASGASLRLEPAGEASTSLAVGDEPPAEGRGVCERCGRPGVTLIPNGGRDLKNLVFGLLSLFGALVVMVWTGAQGGAAGWAGWIMLTLFLFGLVASYYGLRRQDVITCNRCGHRSYVMAGTR